MPRFFINQEHLAVDETGAKIITFAEEDAYHIARVLRMKPGEKVTAADRRSRVYYLVLTKVSTEAVCGKVLKEELDQSEPEIKITLLQSILKGEKMDLVLQKGTEVGVSAFIPFLSTRTVARPNPGQFQKKQERWQRIVEEAAKQCGRGIIPKVNPIVNWERLEQILSQRPSLVAWEEERASSLRETLDTIGKPAELLLIIGPEGGLAETEVEQLLTWGALSVSLGSRILRAETAGPVMSGILMYHFGELEPIHSTALSSGR